MASTVPVTAHMVGQAFVSQYYSVLQHWPHMVYRFYTDASRLTRAESGPDGAVLSARSQMDIHNVVMSMGYQDCKAEILSVDSSESFGGSVLVLVTGIMSSRHGSRRSFVQTFFLAPQERGYYVLNDVFRYLDDEPKIMAQQMAVNGSLHMLDRLHIASDAGCVARNFSSSATCKDATTPVPLSDYVNHAVMTKNEQVIVKGNVPHQQIMDSMPIEKLGSGEQLSAVDDTRTSFEDGSTEKKSYASILRHQREGGQTAVIPTYQQTTPEQLQADFGHQHNGVGLLENPPVEENTNLNSGSGDVQSIYIKNLPANITESQIEDDLMKIGALRPSSVVLKSYKDGGVYAFVEFDDTESGRKAIEASPVLIGGKKAHVEERRSTYTGGRGRGRASGRGSSNSGTRGRGMYNAGSRSSRTHSDSDAPCRGGARGDAQGNLNAKD